MTRLAQTLFEEISDAAFLIDPGTMRFLNVNAVGQQLTGMTHKELLELPVEQLFRSDNDDEGIHYLQRALHNAEPVRSRAGFSIRCGTDGTWIPVAITLASLQSENRRIGLVLARDLTEQVRADQSQRLANATLERRVQERTAELSRINEALRQMIAERERVAMALRESEERFRGVFEHSSVAMVFTDLDNRIVRVNITFARMFGYSPPEMLSTAMDDLTDPNDLAEWRAHREALLAGEVSFLQIENRYFHKDGRTFWGLTNVSLVRDAAGRPLLFVCGVQDITEPKQAQESLHLFRILIDNTTDGIEVVDPETGRYFDVNERACLVHGYSREEYLALSVPDIDPVIAAKPWGQESKECRSHGPKTFESRHRRKDGSTFPVEINLSPIHYRDRDYMMAVVHDISDRRQLEDQIRQLHSMDGIGLAREVAHEFNNLLTVINSYSDLILGSLAADDPNGDVIRQVFAAGERVSGLTRQFLPFGQKAVIEPKVLNLATVVTDIERMLRRIVGVDI